MLYEKQNIYIVYYQKYILRISDITEIESAITVNQSYETCIYIFAEQVSIQKQSVLGVYIHHDILHLLSHCELI